jgi:hypothetical protein
MRFAAEMALAVALVLALSWLSTQLATHPPLTTTCVEETVR